MSSEPYHRQLSTQSGGEAFAFDELPCDYDESNLEASFVWEELPENASASQELSAALRMEGDSSDPNDMKKVTAMLQRRLQSIGDTAERELNTIRRRQLSPITHCGREVWGDRPKFIPTPSTSKDPLQDNARKSRWSGHERPNNLRPRACTSHQVTRRHFPRKHGMVSSKARATLQRQKDQYQDATDICEVSLVMDSRNTSAMEDYHEGPRSAWTGCGARALVQRGSSCIMETPAGSSSASEGDPLSRNSMVYDPIMTHEQMTRSPVPVARDSTSRSTILNDPALPSETPSRSTVLGPLRSPNSAMHSITDPLTLLLMYKRTLLQETNNGLMGGAVFVSQPAHSGSSHADLSQYSSRLEVGQWKGVVSRGSLSPLLSRS